MANGNNTPGPVRPPGPKPQFPYRRELRLRHDQEQALVRIAKTLGVSVSDIARWMIDQGVAAIEDTDTYHTLREMKARL